MFQSIEILITKYNYSLNETCNALSINKSSFHNQEITFAKSMPSANYSIILSATISNNTASREVYLSVASKNGTNTKKTTGFFCSGHMGNTNYKITSLHYIAIYIS